MSVQFQKIHLLGRFFRGQRRALICLLVFCSSLQGQKVVRNESIEMRATLHSDCLRPEDLSNAEDTWPVRVVYVHIQKDDGKVRVQYREFDKSCKRVLKKSGEWAAERFEDAKKKLVDAGLHDGDFISFPESSGNMLPISFLAVRSQTLKADVYTMYLRFRWDGKMATDKRSAKILEQWRSILDEVTSDFRTDNVDGGSIDRTVRDCARDWPQDLRPWIWNEARQLVKDSPQNCFQR